MKMLRMNMRASWEGWQSTFSLREFQSCKHEYEPQPRSQWIGHQSRSLAANTVLITNGVLRMFFLRTLSLSHPCFGSRCPR